jgi:tetratricopeptide (TPR) repeat protein
MKEPTTAEEVKVLHNLLRSDPRHYLQIVNEWIEENPRNSHAHFDRHMAWMKLGDPQRAIADLDMVVQLDPKPVAFWARGDVYRCVGEYEKALEDLGRAEAVDPAQWDWCPRPTVMRGWAMRLPRWPVASVYLMTFGQAASKGLLAAARQKLHRSYDRSWRTRGAGAVERGSLTSLPDLVRQSTRGGSSHKFAGIV